MDWCCLAGPAEDGLRCRLNNDLGCEGAADDMAVTDICDSHIIGSPHLVFGGWKGLIRGSAFDHLQGFAEFFVAGGKVCDGAFDAVGDLAASFVTEGVGYLF